jgi:hypothetical protein
MSRTAPGDARQEWPYDAGRNQGYGGHDLPGSGEGDMPEGAGPENDAQWYGDQGYHGQAYQGDGYDGRNYQNHGYDGQGHGAQWNTQGYGNPAYDPQGYGAYGGPDYQGQSYDGQAYGGQAYGGQAYGGQAYGGQAYGGQAYGGQGYQTAWQHQGYADQPTRVDGYAGQYDGYAGQDYQQQGFTRPDHGVPPPPPGQEQGQPARRGARRGRRRRDAEAGTPGNRKVHFRRLRRFARRPTVRVISAVVGVFLIWVLFSAGQAAFKNNGQGFTANLAEWARDHYLGPVVTFGEWLTYQPPKVGGNPSFSYAVPKNEQISSPKGKHKGFVPDIPPAVKTLASGPALPGEGQWRVVEKVKNEPAILVTFLRDGGQYTSYSNGIASIDQRLVRFSLRPGTEDPGSAPGNGGNWGVSDYIPPGQRTGVLATFNGGFKLDAAQGGFYLNGMYHGSLVNGAASIVYYKNGTVKIGEWGRDFTMNSRIEGVRQNLKLLVDHGKVTVNADLAVNTSFGATLGGGYWVWRSGIGITKDGRIIFVYGQALDAQDLGQLLKQAGAVEGMQMDINPEWMKFDYYRADGHPSDPTPVPLLPTQQASPFSYYTPSTRDFTAVYAR